MNRYRLFAGVLAVVAALAAPSFAQDWEEPSHWNEVGAVAQWSALDARFYRVFESVQFLDESQYRVDQVKEYAKTKVYQGSLAGIDLAGWATLDENERKERVKQARRHVKYCVDFRKRVEQQAQNVKDTSTASSWGVQVSDVTVVGDCLTKLNTAVWLDPTNPYNWHLLAYFSRIVGDTDRYEGALGGALAALGEVPDGELVAMRQAIALELAWLYRELGEFDKALASVERARGLGAEGVEPLLIEGLIAAQSGDVRKAGEIATALKSAEVAAFPPNYRSLSYGPDVANIDAWRKKSSNYLNAWILALGWLHEGNVEMAGAAFREYSKNDFYPFAQRFWNDAGWIYEVTGRRKMAFDAWKVARIHNPYIPYMVYKPYSSDLGRLTGRQGQLPYDLGFDHFYLVGNRLAYAAGLVDQVIMADDELAKQEAAARALDQLEICVDTGYYPGQAKVLTGQVYYLMGDLNSALIEIEGALETFETLDDKPAMAAVLEGLSSAKADVDPSDVSMFFGQSGTAQGRWAAVEDPEAHLAALREAYALDASDANRRELARFLIREGRAAEGRTLALGGFDESALKSKAIRDIPGEDIELVLEADRVLESTDLALALVHALDGGAEDPWNDASLWVMAGFVCLDAGRDAEATVALKRASELDPGNQGLKIQLALMGG